MFIRVYIYMYIYYDPLNWNCTSKYEHQRVATLPTCCDRALSMTDLTCRHE